MKLLIVDDSNFIRRAIERHAESFQIKEIRTANTGKAALRTLNEFAPDLITMDITMPEMDGLTCVEAIRRVNTTSRILVISALSDRSMAVEALKRGANGFLLKPFNEESLREAVVDVLED
ncbi:MAG: response regulator transcription factor [Candidatus Methylacidiphilales bacterium]|nr:response regulator [Candidatus Methylacidiphilales bacterium]